MSLKALKEIQIPSEAELEKSHESKDILPVLIAVRGFLIIALQLIKVITGEEGDKKLDSVINWLKKLEV